MNEYEVQVPTMSQEHGRRDYIVKAKSVEAAIKAAKKNKVETIWYKSYGTDNEVELWDEVWVNKI